MTTPEHLPLAETLLHVPANSNEKITGIFGDWQKCLRNDLVECNNKY